MKRAVRLELAEFTLDALAGEVGAGRTLGQARIDRAIRYYLSDSPSGRPEWRCPAAPTGAKSGKRVELELSVEESLWRGLEQEAKRQDVSAQELAEHAALYFAADRDAGRVTQRILDDLDDPPG